MIAAKFNVISTFSSILVVIEWRFTSRPEKHIRKEMSMFASKQTLQLSRNLTIETQTLSFPVKIPLLHELKHYGFSDRFSKDHASKLK